MAVMSSSRSALDFWNGSLIFLSSLLISVEKYLVRGGGRRDDRGFPGSMGFFFFLKKKISSSQT